MRSTIAILLLISATAFCTISPGTGLTDAVIIDTDYYSQNLSNAFDLSKARFPLTTSTTTGRIFGDGVPFQSKDYSAYGVTTLTQTRWVSNNIVVFVYDNYKVVIQIIDGNGKLFAENHFYNFNILQNMYCTGFELNNPRNFLYIGCFGQRTQKGPGKLLISTFDLTLGDVVSQLSFDQQDGFDIKNQLELRIVNAPQDSNDDTYLIAYDMGHGQATSSRHNHQFRVFRNVNFRQLTYYYLGEIAAYDHDNSILYDIFPYNGTIIATGRTEDTQSIITTTQCRLDNANKVLNCGTVKPTLVTEGYVGIYNGSVMVTIDIPTRIVTAYQLEGQYTDKTWKTQIN
jgi:hypothetical protein